MRQAIDLIDKAILKRSPGIEAGRAADMQARQDLLEILPASILSKINNQEKLGPSELKSLMVGNTATTNSINRLANILSQPNLKSGKADAPKVSLFPEVARHAFNTVIDQNAQKGLSAGSSFVAAIRGQEGTKLNKKYNTILDNVARAKNLGPKETVAFKSGLNDVLDVLESTGSVEGFSKIPTAKTELDPSIGMRVATNQINRAISILEVLRLRKSVNNQKALAKVITSEDGISELVKLGKQARDVRQASSALRTLIIAAREGTQSEEDINSGLLGQ